MYVESILNSRRISSILRDPSDLASGHFLVDDFLAVIPEHDVYTTRSNILTSWREISNRRNEFGSGTS